MNKQIAKVTRRLDDLNRIVLPKDVREFGWGKATPLDVYLMAEGESVVLRAHKPSCTLCGDMAAELIAVSNGSICKACLKAANEAG